MKLFVQDFYQTRKVEDYETILNYFLNKKIPLICANPDDVVH